jgi:hypothetical protein
VFYYVRHYWLGLISGRLSTCGTKINYKSRNSAEKAARKMSIKYKKEKEAYPCIWCKGWHIGRKM